MNPFALVPLAASVVNLLAAFVVVGRGVRTRLHRSYLWLALTISLWSLSDFVLWAGLARGWVELLLRVQVVAYLPVGWLFLRFCQELTGQAADSWSRLLDWLAPVAMVIGVVTPWMRAGHHQTHWGLVAQPGPLYLPIVLPLIVLPGIRALYLVGRNLSRISTKRARQQHWVVLLGALTPHSTYVTDEQRSQPRWIVSQMAR